MTKLTDKPKRGRPAESGYKIPPTSAAALQAEGLSYSDIATRLGVSLTTVSRLLTKSREGSVDTSERVERFCRAVNSGDTRAVALLEAWAPSHPQTITLDRTGAEPLRFIGQLIRDGSTRLLGTTEAKPHPDWWDVRIFAVLEKRKTTGGELHRNGFAVSIRYSTLIKTVVSTHELAKFTKDPAAEITGYNPLERLRGFPKKPEYASRQDYLERSSKLQYEQLVTQLLRDPL